MSLIEVNIPEEEGWRDDVASRVLCLVLGMLLMRAGLRMWAAASTERLAAAAATALLFALGVQIAILAAADIDFEEHGRKIGYAVVGLLTVLTVIVIWQTDVIPRLNSDVLAFTSHAVEVAQSGGNPFAASMAPAADLPGAPGEWTYRTDGSRVEEWSYPGGTLWAYSAQFAVIGRGPIGLRLTSMLAVGGLAALLVWALPSTYFAAGPLALLGGQNTWLAAAGGLNDMWWVLPATGALVLWAQDRRLATATAIGVAMAMKQQAWVLGPFLAIWVWRERESLAGFARQATAYGAVGVAAFGVLNLPWIVTSPTAWLTSVFVPLGTGGDAPLVSTGVGLAALNTATDGALVARGTFDVLIFAVVAGSAVAYWRWFDELRWAAWVLPAAVFLMAPRSLPSYFYWFLPLALLALFAAHGEIRGQREVAA